MILMKGKMILKLIASGKYAFSSLFLYFLDLIIQDNSIFSISRTPLVCLAKRR